MAMDLSPIKAKQRVEGSPSTKLDSILFESDDGPVSSLFKGGGLDSAIETTKDPTNENKLTPRKVNFDKSADSISLDNNKKSKIDMQEPVSVDDIEKMRKLLHKAQADLATEKTNRKRKEKSLIKLAKELNSRASDAELRQKEAELRQRKLDELTETNEDLMNRLAERNREQLQNVHFETKYNEAKAKVAELKQVEQKNKQIELEVAELKQVEHTYKELAARQVTELQQVEQQYNEMATQVAELKLVATQHEKNLELANAYANQVKVDARLQVETAGAQAHQANAEATKAKKALAAALQPRAPAPPAVAPPAVSRHKPRAEAPTSCRGVLVGLVVAALFLVASVALVALGLAVSHTVVSVDGLCAPVRPGSTILGTATGVFEAPWWAPDAHKEDAHAFFCEERVRSRLHVQKGKVEVSVNGEPVWNGRAVAGLTVHADKMELVNKKGKVEEVAAPWRGVQDTGNSSRS